MMERNKIKKEIKKEKRGKNNKKISK